MNVRVAQISDARDIARLTTELGYPADEATLASRLGALLGIPDQLVLVAVAGTEVIGWLQAHASVVLESGHRVEIVGLIVSPAARRRGVGRELVQRAEQWATGLGARTMVVRSNLTRLESHHFYPALGFTLAKNQAVYRRLIPATPTASRD
jgi:predicted N-acetyltransferase YhbS